MGAGHQEDHAMIRSSEFQPHSPSSRNPHKKSPKYWVCRASRLNIGTCQEGGVPQIHGDREAPALRTLQDLALCFSLSGCSTISFILLLIDKHEKCFPETHELF